MSFYTIFISYILFNIFLFFKVKDFFKFFTVNSFLNGILQCFILFLIFLNLLINVKYTLLILISRMDFFENGYIFFKFLERNLFIIFFKTVYFLSFFLFIKQINSKEEKI
ncbi:MAG: hypothetical protein XD76_0974 [candidate division TA06 bacterium 32_111]|nr:MAG: hypothetical protein XD76_0974 [candidate division TA06 bacterium 32_111]